MKVLALNAGSSTLKFAVVDLKKDVVLLRGSFDQLDHPDCKLELSPSQGEMTKASVGAIQMSEAVRMATEKCGKVDAVGCRVVHGGAEFHQATPVNSDVLDRIRKLEPLAPLHNAKDLEVIETVQKLLTDVPVVAVFDTSFHQNLPPVASQYGLPTQFAAKNQIRRYGFHGISYQYIVNRFSKEMGTHRGRWVICHLGSGASICAVRDGVSIETSMGMTPVEGLIMGTRSGDLDPGAVLYMLRETGMTVEQVDSLINHQSGLLGLSGKSSDVRELEKMAKQRDIASEFALEAFSYRLAKYIGAYSVVLDGLDALVFSGGIGENSEEIRHRVCRRLKSLGIKIPIHPPQGEVTQISDIQFPSVWVVRTDEELQIAKETASALKAA